MNTLRKLSLTAATSVAALGFVTASAAITVTDGDGELVGTYGMSDGLTGADMIDAGTLGPNGALNIDDDDLVDMQELDELIEFVIGEQVSGATTAFGVEFPQGTSAPVPGQAGILGFTADLIVNGMTVETLNVTNSVGRLDLDSTTFSFVGLNPGDVVRIALAGTVYEMQGADAQFSISVRAADAVPVPAAGLLFGTAALAGAAARRKRKLV